jgi:hypothetical protein
VNNPPNLTGVPPGIPQVSNHGTVSGTFAGSPVDTNTINTSVDLFNSKTTLATDHPSGANSGDTVTFTATVAIDPTQIPTPPSPVTPTGTVTFKDGASNIAGCVNVALVSGQAQCQTTALTVAGSPHSITADYSGDGNYDPVTSNTVSQAINACQNSITVTSANDSGAVDYRTMDTDTFTVGCRDTVNNLGSAYGRCDFSNVVGTLGFAAGETMKTFGVPIINDSYHEGNESFTVLLSNPSGGVLGATFTAIVTIIDNDAVDGPNPILQTDSAGVAFFVRQHYLDFLGREPEAGEPWSAILLGCPDQFNVDPNSPSAACDRITVSGSFFGSPEFRDKGLYVIGFYRVAFNRLPSYWEFVQDRAAVSGQTAQETFAKRAAYTGSGSDRVRVNQSYPWRKLRPGRCRSRY